MPMGWPSHTPEPKSGCNPLTLPIELMYLLEFLSIGRLSTAVFHILLEGNMLLPAI
jgi:hypothetical protein